MIAGHIDPDIGSISRRRILQLTATAAVFPVSMQVRNARAASGAPADATGVKAMTFDIQGTPFDYYAPFVRISTALDDRKGFHLNWSDFLRDWNAAAVSIILSINSGQRVWLPPGQIFRQALDALLSARGINGRLDAADRIELMSVWREMVPWQDSAEGLSKLKSRYTVAALSNAGMAGVIALAKKGDLPFDAILTAELTRSYKPARAVYEAASTCLGFAPNEIMMVAAHKFDLKAAKEAGFKTAYIPRALEFGPDMAIDRSPESYIDVLAEDLVDLSRIMGLT